MFFKRTILRFNAYRSSSNFELDSPKARPGPDFKISVSGMGIWGSKFPFHRSRDWEWGLGMPASQRLHLPTSDATLRLSAPLPLPTPPTNFHFQHIDSIPTPAIAIPASCFLPLPVTDSLKIFFTDPRII